MNGDSEKNERDGRNDRAARVLNRRIRAKDRYRLQRDKKFKDQWLGHDFRFLVEHMRTSTCSGWITVTLERYNPQNHTITLRVKNSGVVVWDTDDFWALSRTGRIEHA